ncbi:MAG: VOC family protein, partial [Planctomycetaceae bacterium]|nr:VOC family protein [Planctomycetaceae bacterium]
EPTPPGMLPPGYEKKVMHSSFRIGESMVMATDGCDPSEKPGAFTLTLTVANEAEADKAFAGLSDGGTVVMPLGKTFWSPRFGMLKDRFGVSWMVMVPGEDADCG